nr:LOW QUALITY PROTEIN: uncharacterized protein LOC108066628 [Drosophila takahashii]
MWVGLTLFRPRSARDIAMTVLRVSCMLALLLIAGQGQAAPAPVKAEGRTLGLLGGGFGGSVGLSAGIEWAAACIAGLEEAADILVAMRVAIRADMAATPVIPATAVEDTEVATIQEEVTPALDTGRTTMEAVSTRAADRTTTRADPMAASTVSRNTPMDTTMAVATEAVATEAVAMEAAAFSAEKIS